MASKILKVDEIEYKISYDFSGAKDGEAVLFLHGWGADKELMKMAFKDSLSDFFHIYLDLPGFGASDIKTPLKSDEYAKIVKNFIASLPKKPKIIIAHSFGGKIATLLKPEVLVLLSSAGIIEPKPFLVKFKIKTFKILKAFGFSKFYKFFASKDAKNMNETMYQTFKNVVNENYEPKFRDYEGRALIFWGKDDSATSLKSGKKIHSLIKNSAFYPLDGDHFFFLKNADFIAQKIANELKNNG